MTQDKKLKNGYANGTSNGHAANGHAANGHANGKAHAEKNGYSNGAALRSKDD